METPGDSRIFKIQRILSAAGGDVPFIERFLALERQHDRREQYRLLSLHRAALLDGLHQEQYKIDCLDHMVYTMQKEDQKKNGGI